MREPGHLGLGMDGTERIAVFPLVVWTVAAGLQPLARTE